MVSSYYLALIVIIAGMLLSIRTKKLTHAAAVLGGVSASVILTATGIIGVALLAAFFLMGVAATTHQREYKHQHGLTDNIRGERTAAQVFANSGIAVIVSVMMLIKQIELTAGVLMVAGSFAAAAADTVSSELGSVYGKRFYDILSLKKTARGVNGAVSLEGTLTGITASFLIAIIHAIGSDYNLAYILIIVLAGTLGNIADSILGTAFENKKLLTNNLVNFINTAVGALSSLLLYCLLHH